MADFNSVANQFALFYYKTFDSNRSELHHLYRGNSMLTFENAQIQGVDGIAEKLVSLPFEKVEHRITTLDAQPAGPSGNIIVLVTGELVIDGGDHPQRYSQSFHLVPENHSYYVLNDIFRLVYG